jgi:hypothetical protein
MQTKFSYRVLKWTFLVGAFATLGTACVVTSGDGDDDFPGDGGESGSSTTTAGKASTAGTGGSATAGTSTGGKGGTAATPAGGAGGDGGDDWVPGACEDDLATPSNPRDTTLNADDAKPAFACRKCLKVSCADAWSTCYGDTPTIACGYGSTEEAPGQFECIRSCFVEDMSGDDAETVLSACESECLDQCADKDQGFATSETQEMLDCGQEKCLAECFTP